MQKEPFVYMMLNRSKRSSAGRLFFQTIYNTLKINIKKYTF